MTDQVIEVKVSKTTQRQDRTGQRNRNYEVAFPCCVQSTYYMTGPNAFPYPDQRQDRDNKK